MSQIHYEMLAWLSDTPGSRLPMTELARHTGVSTSRLSHLVDRLENQGWVQRLTVCTDGRVHLAYPTETGLRVLEDATPSHAPVRAVQPPRSPRRRTVPPAPRQQRTPSAAHKANRRSWPHRTGAGMTTAADLYPDPTAELTRGARGHRMCTRPRQKRPGSAAQAPDIWAK